MFYVVYVPPPPPPAYVEPVDRFDRRQEIDRQRQLDIELERQRQEQYRQEQQRAWERYQFERQLEKQEEAARRSVSQ